MIPNAGAAGEGSGVTPFETLSSLLASTPQPGMRATALDAPGSMLFEIGGKWGGSFGRVTALQVAALQAAIASIAIGAEAEVPNAAVPGGLSRLRRCVAAWAPPAGELIAAAFPTSPSSQIALIIPGVTTLVQIWAGAIIPDYMLPDLLEMEFSGNLGAINAAGTPGCIVGIGVSGKVPTGTREYEYPLGVSTTPGTVALGIGQNSRVHGALRGGLFRHAVYMSKQSSYDQNACGPFVYGANRLYAMAVPSKTDDQIRFDGAQVFSKGVL